MQVFNGRLYFLQSGAQTGSGALGVTSPSSMYRVDSVPTLPVIKPAAPLFTAPLNWEFNDFDLADDTIIFIGGQSGLYAYLQDADSGAWTYTLYADVYPVIAVGVSSDGRHVFATVANETYSALYALDFTAGALNGTWANGGAPIMTPQPGFQLRGVAALPIQPVPSVTATGTRSSTRTRSATASVSTTATGSATATRSISISASGTATPSSSHSAGATSSQTGSITLTSSITPTRTGTPTQSATASTSSTANWFWATGFVASRLVNGSGMGDSGSQLRMQTVYVDDYSGCDGSAPCARRRSLPIQSVQSGSDRACTLATQTQMGRLARSANGETVTLYGINSAAGSSLTASSDLDGTVAYVYYHGGIRTTTGVPKAMTGGVGFGE